MNYQERLDEKNLKLAQVSSEFAQKNINQTTGEAYISEQDFAKKAEEYRNGAVATTPFATEEIEALAKQRAELMNAIEAISIGVEMLATSKEVSVTSSFKRKDEAELGFFGRIAKWWSDIWSSKNVNDMSGMTKNQRETLIADKEERESVYRSESAYNGAATMAKMTFKQEINREVESEGAQREAYVRNPEQAIANGSTIERKLAKVDYNKLLSAYKKSGHVIPGADGNMPSERDILNNFRSFLRELGNPGALSTLDQSSGMITLDVTDFPLDNIIRVISSPSTDSLRELLKPLLSYNCKKVADAYPFKNCTTREEQKDMYKKWESEDLIYQNLIQWTNGHGMKYLELDAELKREFLKAQSRHEAMSVYAQSIFTPGVSVNLEYDYSVSLVDDYSELVLKEDELKAAYTLATEGYKDGKSVTISAAELGRLNIDTRTLETLPGYKKVGDQYVIEGMNQDMVTKVLNGDASFMNELAEEFTGIKLTAIIEGEQGIRGRLSGMEPPELILKYGKEDLEFYSKKVRDGLLLENNLNSGVFATMPQSKKDLIKKEISMYKAIYTALNNRMSNPNMKMTEIKERLSQFGFSYMTFLKAQSEQLGS